MASLLLLIIYISFIGLGIPDSLFGSAWPAIYTDLGLPVSSASFVTMTVSGCTIISSLLSARLIHRFGTSVITAASTLLTAFALLGFSLSANLLCLCLCAIPLGLGAGCVDTALNHYVALHYKASHMNFLHCFYGIGVTLSPFLMSLALSAGSWRSGYRTVFFFQLFIGILTTVSLPIWRKAGHTAPDEEAHNSRPAGFLSLIRIPKVRRVCMVFIGSCGLEYTCGGWGSTFLVRSRGLSTDTAALIITFYYAGMAAGRFLSGILSARFTPAQLVKAGQRVTACALVLLLLPLPSAAAGVSLFLIGLGNGPVFPNMLHLTPQHFTKELSQSVMGIQMAASYTGIMLTPALFGPIAETAGTAVFPFYLLAAFTLMAAGSLLIQRKSA